MSGWSNVFTLNLSKKTYVSIFNQLLKSLCSEFKKSILIFSFFNHAKAIQQECDWENEERAIPMQTAFPSTLAISKRMVR